MHDARGGRAPCTGRLVHTEARGQVLELRERPLTIGRGPEGVDWRLPGARVSRRHLRLEPLATGTHLLVDLGSCNGTYVNDRRVASAVLEPFDRVRAGDHVLVYLDPRTSVEKVIELMSPGETSHGRGAPGRSLLAERLLALTLLVQERGCDLDLVTTLDAVLEEVLTWTGHRGGLFLLHEPGRALEPVHAQGLDPSLLEDEPLAAFVPLVEATLEEGRSGSRATPLGQATLCVPLESRRPGTQGGASGPGTQGGASGPGIQGGASGPGGGERRRVHPGEVRGALLLTGGETPADLAEEEETLLRALTRQVAVVISNARLTRQVTTDALTELPNRAWLERILAEALLASRDGGAGVGLVLLDVDDFKRVNDTFGHVTGDAVLRQVAQLLPGALRHSDTAGRWGGEEFLIVLPDTDLAGAALVAAKLVELVRTAPSPHTGAPVTISAGVAAAPQHGLDAEELVRRADLALYAAKRAGKDRHCEYAPPLEQAAPPLGDTLRLGAAPLLPPPDEDQEPEGPPAVWLDCELLAPIPLHAGTTSSVGRSRSCSVVLPHRSVSRVHGLLHVAADGARVSFEDRSRNGSLKEGQPVRGAVELVEGETLGIGPYQLRLRRGRRHLEALETQPGVDARCGRLEETSLCQVLRDLERGRETGKLSASGDGLSGELLLREGHPVDARAEGPAERAQGVEAVRALLQLERGAWIFQAREVRERRRIPFSTAGLLRELCPAGPADGLPCTRGAACPRERTPGGLQHFAG